MRNCPACGGRDREDLGNYDNSLRLVECYGCGMRYLDASNVTQAYFDEFYFADTSPDLHDADSLARLTALAQVLKTIGGRGVDIGGKYCHELREMVPGLESTGVGDELEGLYDYACVSHTLEHVYDIDGFMQNMVSHLTPRGRVVIEVPIWHDYNDLAYDPYWQHVNKFTPIHLMKLFTRYGFGVTGRRLPGFQSFHCWRLEGVRRENK